MCWRSRQHLLFAVHQIRRAKCRQLESVPVSDGVGRARLHAISAKNAAVVVNVVNLGVTLGAAYSMLGRILRCLDVNAVRRTIRRAKEASHTLFQPIFVALQNMHAAKALLEFRAP